MHVRLINSTFYSGQVTDVYVPSPFRHFAFVQFSESKVAQSLLGKEHIIKVYYWFLYSS